MAPQLPPHLRSSILGKTGGLRPLLEDVEDLLGHVSLRWTWVLDPAFCKPSVCMAINSTSVNGLLCTCVTTGQPLLLYLAGTYYVVPEWATLKSGPDNARQPKGYHAGL